MAGERKEKLHLSAAAKGIAGRGTEIGRHVAEVGERRPAERRLRPIELDDAQRRRQRDQDGRYIGAQERMPAEPGLNPSSRTNPGT